MASPRVEESRDYLEKHKILELFNNLTSQLVFNRPEHPKQFMIEVIERLKECRTGQIHYPCLFDDTNVTSVFGMLDPTKKGVITLAQYKEAMATVGVEGFDEYPNGAETDRITQETFIREARHGLKKASATFMSIP